MFITTARLNDNNETGCNSTSHRRQQQQQHRLVQQLTVPTTTIFYAIGIVFCTCIVVDSYSIVSPITNQLRVLSRISPTIHADVSQKYHDLSATIRIVQQQQRLIINTHSIVCQSTNTDNDIESSNNNNNDKKDEKSDNSNTNLNRNIMNDIDRTSFDEAGRSLLDEQDMKRMNEMGDFDTNPNSSLDQMDQMRAAIRARTAAMGLEKSKVSADYIAQRQQEIINAGGAKAAAENDTNNMFGGLDLSKISTEREVSKAATKNGLWLDKEDEMPSMFYDPEDELSVEERAEVDPIGQKSFIEQGLNELQNAKWPTPIAALREVALMIVIIAITGALIIGWDKVIRTVYTDVLHFIPSKEDLTNYMNRFDGLDLPSGWTDNMNEDDISSLSDKISNVIPTTTSSAISSDISTGTTLPEL